MEIRDWRRWLQPGMSVKRWFALLASGVILASLGLAMALAWAYRHFSFPDPVTGFVQNLTLQFIPHPYREGILVGIGLVAIVLGFVRVSKSVIKPLMDLIDSDLPLIDLLQKQRYPEHEDERIRVVSIGGGTGLSTLLRGLKTIDAFDITAIVTVADDGGSTGRIRRDFEIPAPGDIRNCIVALAEDESIVAKLFDYRFDREGSELQGHSFGNLFITALSQVTGSFEEAVIESAKVLATRGRVFPSTLESVDLCAEMEDGRTLCGESAIGHSGGRINNLYLQRADTNDNQQPSVYEPALTAIRNADLIVLGPGSLYTSVIPNLLFGSIARAVRASTAPIVYVCNVATQHGETDHFGAADHIREVVKYVGSGTVSYALVNNNRAVEAAIKTGVPVEAVVD
ncbi:MAG: gluconeogenesis factor YvcK family protein, partial [Thermomicrobiales bacterium]